MTHLDDHMGTVLAPEFVAIYVRVAADYRLPPVICHALAAYGGPHNLRGVRRRLRPRVALARAAGFRSSTGSPRRDWDSALPPEAAARAMIEGLAPGLSFLALHVTRPGEIAAIDPALRGIRTGEYALSARAGSASG